MDSLETDMRALQNSSERAESHKFPNRVSKMFEN